MASRLTRRDANKRRRQGSNGRGNKRRGKEKKER